MKMTSTTTAALLFCFLFSCTITKKLHRPGWHIDWHKKNHFEKENNRSGHRSEKDIIFFDGLEAGREQIIEKMDESGTINTFDRRCTDTLSFGDGEQNFKEMTRSPILDYSERSYYFNSLVVDSSRQDTKATKFQNYIKNTNAVFYMSLALLLVLSAIVLLCILPMMRELLLVIFYLGGSAVFFVGISFLSHFIRSGRMKKESQDIIPKERQYHRRFQRISLALVFIAIFIAFLVLVLVSATLMSEILWALILAGPIALVSLVMAIISFGYYSRYKMQER